MQATSRRKAIVYGTLIRSILLSYELNERTNAIDDLLRGISTMLNKAHYTHPFVMAEGMLIATGAWEDAIAYFKGDNKMIESTTCVVDFYNQASKELQKFAGIGNGKINRFVASHNGKVLDSYEVSDYIIKLVKAELGEQHLTLAERIAMTRQGKAVNPQINA